MRYEALEEGEPLERVRHYNECIHEGPGQVNVKWDANFLPLESEESVKKRVQEVAGLALETENIHQVQLRS